MVAALALKTLKIFVSSPGDVGRERQQAERVLKQLQGEFARRILLESYFWEHEAMRGTTDYQGNIPKLSEYDIVICILWARLGSPLSEKYQRPNNQGRYDSGTEYELETAIESNKANGAPDLLVYRNRQTAMVSVDDRKDAEEKMRQSEALSRFLQRWTQNPDGTFRLAVNEYRERAQFEDMLEHHLRKIIEEKAPPLSASPSTAVRFGTYVKGSPFRRLAAFEFDDADVFFGRTRAIDDVLDALEAKAKKGVAFTLIFGGSGSGKSSLARAGVMPLVVKPGVIEGIGLWRWAITRPGKAGSDLFAGLAAALLSDTALPEMKENGMTAERLATTLREAPKGVPDLLGMSLQQTARDLQEKMQLAKLPETRLLLLVDQLEELFTMGDSFAEETRTQFVAALDALARSGVVWVLATLRSEFFSRCDKLEVLAKLKEGEGQYQLLPPSKAELRQIVRLPAIAAGLEFETDQTGANLDDVLLDMAGGNTGALPLIEFTLDELYKRRRDDRMLTHSALADLKGMEGALETAAEEVFGVLAKKFPTEIEALFADVFRALATIDLAEKGAFVRRIADLERLASTPARREFIEGFVEGRLLVTDRDEEGRAAVQVAHESLFLHWPRLAKMLEANREFLERRARAGVSYGIWKEQRSDRSYLWWHGRPLGEARELLARGDELTPREKEFAEASSRAGTVALRKRIAAIVLALLLVAGAGRVWYQKEQVRKESARQAQREATLADLRGQLAKVPSSDSPLIEKLSGEIVALDPTDSEARKQQARALVDLGELGRFDQAIERWSQVERPLPPVVLALRGDRAMRNGNDQEAIEHWNEYLRDPTLKDSEKERTLASLAEAHLRLADWTSAKNRLDQWIALNARSIPALLLQMKVHHHLEDWAAEKRDYEAATLIDPRNDELKKVVPPKDMAAVDATTARVEEDPDSAAAWLSKAEALARSGDLHKAFENAETAQGKDPDSVRPLIEMTHLEWLLHPETPDEPGAWPTERWTRDPAKLLDSFNAVAADLKKLAPLDGPAKAESPTRAALLSRGALLKELGYHFLADLDFRKAAKANTEPQRSEPTNPPIPPP